MIILTVNTGSSSVRLAACPIDPSLPRHADWHVSNPTEDAAELLTRFIDRHGIGQVGAVVHRVVHGGPNLTRPRIIDAEVEAEIRRLSALAPLHNPRALDWIAASRRAFGELPLQIAVFDTALFSTLPAVAATYALPQALRRRYGIRRFGFHGLAHTAMWRRWCELAPEWPAGGRTISLQLGSGCSVAALADGEPVDTSMGFSPLEGLVMATRSGDLDPGLVTFLARSEGLSPEQLETLLNKESGLLGLSGTSGDMQALLETDAAEARLAVDTYCYRARKYIGAYMAGLGGAEAVLFGGGVGENAAVVRSRILSGLSALGIVIDEDANHDAEHTSRISTSSSRVQVWTIAVDEADEMAKAGRDVLAART